MKDLFVVGNGDTEEVKQLATQYYFSFTEVMQSYKTHHRGWAISLLYHRGHAILEEMIQ
jgi:hypothetical protein